MLLGKFQLILIIFSPLELLLVKSVKSAEIFQIILKKKLKLSDKEELLL